MTIVLASDAKTIAGGENYLLALAEGLRERGHTVIAAPEKGSPLAEAARARGFETVEIAYGKNGREFAAAFRLYRALRKRGVDVVHTNANYDRTAGALAARLLGAVSVTTIHSCLPIRHNLTHAFRNRFCIDHFTPVGWSTREIMIEHDRIAPDRITVVHIGIPEHDTAFSPEGRARLRREWGIDGDQPVIGNLARLVAFKGHRHLLDAMPRILAETPRAVCVVAGEGELRSSLEERAAALGTAAAVRFIGHRNDVSDVLSAFDLYVQPSIDFGGETFPVSILQAMAVGLPVVASDVGDIRFMVDDGRTGILVPPQQPRALAEACTVLCRDPAQRKRMGERGRERFLERFTLPRMARDIEEVYKKAVAERAGRSGRRGMR
ncbi:MAG: glycosyltransferase family 4 protein [Bacteroidota bacterium]|nr:glycosyltransferase family 4 protein [Bacteroidota bacterium]